MYGEATTELSDTQIIADFPADGGGMEYAQQTIEAGLQAKGTSSPSTKLEVLGF
jgi:hypothetical protein